MSTEFCETILLTGAGFTKNFGGFLADEMWAQIFHDPEVQNSSYIKQMMLEDFNYESIYQKINNNMPFLSKNENHEHAKSVIKNAVWSAYKKLDDIIRVWNPNIYSPETVNHIKLIEFMKRFVGEPWEKGFFFTLNQDLFIERWFHDDIRIHLPWIESKSKRKLSAKSDLLDIDVIMLPTEEQLQNEETEHLSSDSLNYIKLHGSFNWRSSDGSTQLVIGGEKDSQISEEPLLKSYFEIFKLVLSRPETRLMVIGYGFKDHHINKIITDSVLAHNLKLYVITPSSPKEIVKNIKEADYNGAMVKGLSGVFSHDLAHIFPETHSDATSVAYLTIRKVYFCDESI